MSTTTEPKYKWTLVFGNAEKDHSYWVDEISGGIAIKDESGDYPNQTDDGVLWLDMNSPMILDRRGDHESVIIPLIHGAPRSWESHEEGDKTITSNTLRHAVRVAEKFHMSIVLKGVLKEFNGRPRIVSAEAVGMDLVLKFTK